MAGRCGSDVVSFEMKEQQYETVFIVTPSLSSEEVERCIQGVKRFLVEGGAKIIDEKSWGLKKLAYPIEKKNSGHYYFVEFQALPSLIAAVEVMYKRDERIIRHLVVRLDKHAIAFNRKRKKEEVKIEEV